MRHNAHLNSEIYNKISVIHSKTKYLDNIVELVFINKSTNTSPEIIF